MNAHQLQQVKEIYETVAECATARRAALLQQLCANDETVRAEVEALLGWLPQAADFIEQPPFFEQALLNTVAQSLPPGRRLGPYEVLCELGRGGMGVVYLAVRADDVYRKQVAIKLVWPGYDSAEVVRRFQQERQILANLDHPHITRLLDGGTTEEGWPYVVMEYVNGQPLNQYCDTRQLSVKERLELFQQVCAAVAYAHRHLVVHRDLKPSNILVTEAGVVKLLDFGIAKLLDSAASLTTTGLHAMTPEYASPEQVRGGEITTASDVYSLGVVLYELLTGQPPYRFHPRALHEVLRVVAEDDPLRPSQVCSAGFSRQDSLVTLPAEAGTTNTFIISAAESTPDKLRRRLSGDLDKIILKALRKEPAQRYASVEQLSEDIARHLAGELVIARKPTIAYRAGKFVRRHKTGSAVTVTLLLALLVALSYAVRQTRQTREQARLDRWRSYVADIRQAGQVWTDGNLVRMGELLNRHRPGATVGDDEWRGFEWSLLWKLLHPEKLILQRTSYVNNVLYTPDGRHIFTMDWDNSVEMWEANTGRPLGTFSVESDLGTRALLLLDEKRLAVCRVGAALRVRDIATGQKLFEVRDPALGGPIAFSPDGRLLAVALSDSTVRLLDAATGRLVRTTAGIGDDIRLMRFSSDSRLLAIGGRTGKLCLWAVQTGRWYAAFDRPGKDVTLSTIFGLAFSADGQSLYTGSRDGWVREWDVPGRKLRRAWLAHEDLIDGLALTRDGKLLATSGNDTMLRLWETATQREITTIRNEGPISSLTFSPDERSLAGYCMRQSRAKVWDVQELLSFPLVIRHDCRVRSIAFSSRGDTLAIGDACGTLIAVCACVRPAKW